MIEGLENEFLSDFKEDDKILKGTIRIGTFSTIGRSIVLPALNKFMRDHGDIQFSYMMKELSELPDLLMRSEIDFVFLDQPMKNEGVESVLLGEEEYVHIISSEHETNTDVYLNHDEQDMMSYKYYDFIGTPKKQLKRKFLDEIYSVIDGVASGWGSSILPEHLIKNDKRIKIINPRKKLHSPVYLCYRSRPYYSRTFKAVMDMLSKEVPKRLKAK
jgi:DNA-binding transcriptional LysR family regulator